MTKFEEKVDFLVVGAQKSGTSALDRYLRTHPEIEMASTKEVHYFDNDEVFFGDSNYEEYHRFFTFDDSKIRGESTPVYMYWDGVIERIFEYNPQIKIIGVLRNPIERAYSHWNMETSRSAETLPFSEAIAAEEERRRLVHPLQDRVFSYIDRGFYSRQIERIWQFFPRERTLFLKHDLLRLEPTKFMQQVCNFLQIAPLNKVAPVDAYSIKYQDTLSGRDRLKLEAIFFDEIRQLEEMLSWDCSTWLKNSLM